VNVFIQCQLYGIIKRSELTNLLLVTFLRTHLEEFPENVS